MQYTYSKFQKEINLTGSLIILCGLYIFSYYYVFNNITSFLQSHYFELFLIYIIAFIVSAFINQPYNTNRTIPFEVVIRHMANTLGFYLLLIFAYIGIKGDGYHKTFIFFSYVLTSAGIAIFQVLFLIILKYYRRIGYNLKKVIIVGYGELAVELHSFFTSHPEHGYKFLGYFDNNNDQPDIKGKIDSLSDFAVSHKVDEIYCCLPDLQNEQVQHIVNFGEDNFIKIKLIPDYRGFPYKGVEVRLYDFIPVLEVRPQPLDDSLNRVIKRSFDLVFSILIILLILSWLVPLVALLIKLDSSGPAFFKQQRHGMNNHPFICYKFRTMYINKDADSRQAVKNDPRITRIGKFLRKTSLDEFPQFLNVLKGEMSVIGPRPHPIQLNEDFANLIEKFMLRHSVKPGVTGLAQAKGFRGETSNINDMRSRVKLDRFYVENWSMLFDFRIIIMTINAILRGDEKAF